MARKRFYDAVRDLIREVHDPPEQPSRSRRRLSISSLLATPQPCAACWESMPPCGAFFTCHHCLAGLCAPCLSRYASSASRDRNLLPLRCPHQECRAPLPLSTLHGAVATDVVDKLSRLQCEMVRQKDVDREHEDDGQAAVLKLMQTNGWRRCPQCATGVERTHGCSHMVCVCGGEFCYSCGSPWEGRGRGCASRCGMPELGAGDDALGALLLPNGFDELREELWTRISTLFESLGRHVERSSGGASRQSSGVAQTYRRSPSVHGRDIARQRCVHGRDVVRQRCRRWSRSPLRTVADRQERRPVKMRLRSLVHPSCDNSL